MKRFAKLILFSLVAASLFAAEDKVDIAIERALNFISNGQNERGTFESGPANTYAGIPALCGMAFLAKGYTPMSNPHGPTIMRIIDHLIEKARKEDGYLGVMGGKMYSHSIATLFLSEVSGMVDTNRQAKIEELLPKAVKLILTAQAVNKGENHKGGWRYEPNSTDSDMSCSGWALMALRSARLNGAAVPEEAIEKAVSYPLNHHNDKTGTFGYQDKSSNAKNLTGAGLLCLELCGKHGSEATQKAASFLHKNYRQLAGGSNKLYGLYYAAQGLFQTGGDAWSEFYDWMTGFYIPRQKPDGSWNEGELNCPYYQTALMTLALTVPYRQLPIYQRDETVDTE